MDVDPRHYDLVGINENDIHNVVLSYLVHNCFNETMESFIACTGMKQPDDHLEGMEKRKKHMNLPSYTAMERLIQQTTVVRQCLSQELGKDTPAPFSLKDFLES
ncbi:hypothetical protein SO802_004149 [Lithocarpus litseifolius]|uniref:LisH domain-containing protein n=1 Tax=Lithocarpus litseifolius TaxID=425828 RepID=A0AAW2E626_9ROSI